MPHRILPFLAQSDAAKAAGAVLVNTLALITSFQQHLEWTLRCLSLAGGFVVACLTAVSIVRGWRKK
jgi:hypothetical protein